MCFYLLVNFSTHSIKLKFLSTAWKNLHNLIATGVQNLIFFDFISYSTCELNLYSFSSLHSSPLTQNVHISPLHFSKDLPYPTLCESSHSFHCNDSSSTLILVEFTFKRCLQQRRMEGKFDSVNI